MSPNEPGVRQASKADEDAMAWRSLARSGQSPVHVWGSRLGINHSYCLLGIGNGNLDYLARIWTTLQAGTRQRGACFHESPISVATGQEWPTTGRWTYRIVKSGFRDRPCHDPLVVFFAADLDVITFEIGRAGAHWPGLAGSRYGYALHGCRPSRGHPRRRR